MAKQIEYKIYFCEMTEMYSGGGVLVAARNVNHAKRVHARHWAKTGLTGREKYFDVPTEIEGATYKGTRAKVLKASYYAE